MKVDRAPAVRARVRPLVGLLHSLSDETRLTILFLLAERERDVRSLVNEVRLAQPTVSHHLGLLRMGHLVTTRRNGKQIFYSLSPEVRVNGDTGFVVRRGRLEIRVSMNGNGYGVAISDGD